VAGEKNIFERLKALADKAREETPLATRLFHERLADRSVLEGMRALEKQSDELTFALSEDIMEGAITPAVLRDLLHVTDLMDSVFDDYYFVAREVNRTVISAIELPMLDKMNEIFVGMVNLADRQLEMLGNLLEADSMDEVKTWTGNYYIASAACKDFETRLARKPASTGTSTPSGRRTSGRSTPPGNTSIHPRRGWRTYPSMEGSVKGK
jgi:hypothetical protein